MRLPCAVVLQVDMLGSEEEVSQVLSFVSSNACSRTRQQCCPFPAQTGIIDAHPLLLELANATASVLMRLPCAVASAG
jgi:hypothetical protein